ncbi:MAG TPA: transketolase, partial [Armatimonadetes bacterium]|nr:transketolase [Armatimonadota bacterium]
MPNRGFGPERMAEEEVEELSRIATIARGDVLTMTYLAGSGHPGGAMSSLDILLVLYSKAHIDPERPLMPDRDRIVISHGHISAGVYAALGRLGFFDVEQAVATFRLAGSPFEGHVSTKVPGV